MAILLLITKTFRSNKKYHTPEPTGKTAVLQYQQSNVPSVNICCTQSAQESYIVRKILLTSKAFLSVLRK